MNNDFIVPLNGLPQGRKAYLWTAGKEFFASFENSEILNASLQADVVVEKSGRFIGVDCEISGTVATVCDRCSEELEIPIDTGFSLSVKFGEEPSEEGLFSEGDREIVFLSDSDSDLDLSQTVYDYVCLSLPMQRVHKDGECNPEALKYLNPSERKDDEERSDASMPFAALRSLLEKDNDNNKE